jgi:hypothetical protein
MDPMKMDNMKGMGPMDQVAKTDKKPEQK